MRRATRFALGFACATLFGGCGSTPQPDYFLLTADAPLTDARGGPSVGIATLDVAEYLRRPELVTLAGSNRLDIERYRRWAEPLDEGMRRTLALDLAALLGTDAVRIMPWPRDWVPQWLLRVSVARLDVRANTIELVATWSLQDGARSRPAEEHTARLARPRSGSDGESIAADTSALLLELGRAIADAIAQAAPAAS